MFAVDTVKECLVFMSALEFLLNGSKTLGFREQNFKCLQRTREGLKYINTTLDNTKAHFRPHKKSNFMRFHVSR